MPVDPSGVHATGHRLSAGPQRERCVRHRRDGGRIQPRSGGRQFVPHRQQASGYGCGTGRRPPRGIRWRNPAGPLLGRKGTEVPLPGSKGRGVRAIRGVGPGYGLSGETGVRPKVTTQGESG